MGMEVIRVKAMDNHRKKLALGLSILILIIVGYLSFVGKHLHDITVALNFLEDYSQEQAEEYLIWISGQNRDYMEYIEYRFEEFFVPYMANTNFTDEQYLETFKSMSIELLTPSWVDLDLFVVVDNGDYETFYYSEGYGEFVWEDVKDLIPIGEKTAPICGDTETPFGDGNRFYWTAQHLKGGSEHYGYLDVIVYMGFYEHLLYKSFHDSLDATALQEIKASLYTLLGLTIAFMFTVIVIGFLLVMYTQELEVKVYQAMSDTYAAFEDKDLIENGCRY